MNCPLCASPNLAELTAEINLHFSGLRNLHEPSLLVFPKVEVCLDCGCSRFTMAQPELARLRQNPAA
jgi:hypothetical protein